MQEYSKAERIALAKKSVVELPASGVEARQQLIRELHQLLLEREAVSTDTGSRACI